MNTKKQTGGCLKCEKCEWVRGKNFCGNKKLTDKQLYNDKGYCSDFVPKADMRGGEDNDE